MPAPLENLSLRQQLTVDRRGLRLLSLVVGLTGFGAGVAMMIRAGLGAAPWDVLSVALAERTGLSIGVVTIIVSFVVLLAWIPLRQHPGIGTIANALWIGIAVDLTLHVLPPVDALLPGLLLLLGGVIVNAASSALYIGALLGPGPRDGLMTGIHHRWGLRIGRVRLVIEVAVLGLGWILGGPLGIGTIIYALAVGPIVHLVLPRVTIPVRREPSSVPVLH
ncbi:membrane protein YczE [Brachybacterium tyrofermentans]|uniref:membrane protein YczE n=1 Tax=Brachybacterium tyrofermentans TaxID=47848 RepID=UPI003F8DEB5B